MLSKIDQSYKLFNKIDFFECADCNCCVSAFHNCCYFPWLLKEEYSKHLEKFGKTVRQINSVAFVVNSKKCKFLKKDGCGAYKDRPLDCRLFPLDIIEERGVYHWCIFTNCPKHKQIRIKLLPLMKKLEKKITKKMFNQYIDQIALTKEIYLPYKLGQYEKIKLFKPSF